MIKNIANDYKSILSRINIKRYLEINIANKEIIARNILKNTCNNQTFFIKLYVAVNGNFVYILIHIYIVYYYVYKPSCTLTHLFNN